ncbi:hypothetical protein QTI24_28595 [Variovorax sp. J22P240]|uniref:hypothetical protein n=1 Tax=Variovorax sp. J22P240 TaxID=3053514 RepID=UPI002578A464|nr:hypothetical protein [Variovorax sp. J22P240]MDM0002593.1 hypothetical protein [Variovorax sp. J22P240]
MSTDSAESQIELARIQADLQRDITKYALFGLLVGFVLSIVSICAFFFAGLVFDRCVPSGQDHLIIALMVVIFSSSVWGAAKFNRSLGISVGSFLKANTKPP